MLSISSFAVIALPFFVPGIGMAAKCRKWILLVEMALLVMAAAAIVRAFTNEGLGSFDFHCFWYGGNHIWQGTDPYRAFLERKDVALPVSYLDGVVVREGGIEPFSVKCAPGNTAPVVFLLSLLARLSWSTARTTWLFLNIAFALGIGWILPKILKHSPVSHEEILLPLFMIAQIATRETLDLGQTSLFISLCMFASMFLSYHRRAFFTAVVSGILLGFALSKLLLAFPLLLLFAYRRKVLEILVAACIQTAGVLGLALLGTSVPGIIAEYFSIFMMHLRPGTQDGMHLTAGLLKGWQPYSYILIAAGSVVLCGILLQWHRSRPETRGADAKTDLVLLTAVMFWNLLVFYHRRYDYVAASSFSALMIYWAGSCCRSARRPVEKKAWIFRLGLGIMIFWIIPFYRVLHPTAYRYLYNICTLAALCLSTWMLFHWSPAGDRRCEKKREET
jgi:hypothetical protein